MFFSALLCNTFRYLFLSICLNGWDTFVFDLHTFGMWCAKEIHTFSIYVLAGQLFAYA